MKLTGQDGPVRASLGGWENFPPSKGWNMTSQEALRARMFSRKQSSRLDIVSYMIIMLDSVMCSCFQAQMSTDLSAALCDLMKT